ncbi:hypothetical protein V1525DRAFT_351491 [Lipomyces kononenkoae]|uniref:Uncharacterized protein n=1 Tax=Lipomyces kononenkoae TaxID=34357 RepID=A0ACC3TCC4_LIPKO
MADDEEAARQEKLAAARKRFEELKKQQDKKPSKKKGPRKDKTESEAAAAATTSDAPERTDSPATVAPGTETPPPPEEGIAVVENADDATGATNEDEEDVDDKDAKADNDSAVVIAELRSRVSALEVENAALKDSLATANVKIQLDASTISSLQAQLPKTPIISPTTGEATTAPMSPSNREEYYRVLEEKFSREAQERYLLERDYASLARTHDKLVSAHNAVVAELERLKMRFSAEEKRRQMPEGGEEQTIDEKQALAARERAANINARISAGTSSLFRTAQGFSAAVVKGVTGGANAVIDGGAPAMMRRASSNKSSRIRAGSSASYADVDLYADDGVLGEDEEEDDEAAYQRGLERARLAAAEQREKEAKQDANAKRLHWFKNEMEKWKGFQLDLTKAGGSPAAAGPIFEV